MRKCIKENNKLFVNSNGLQFFLELPPLEIKEFNFKLRAVSHPNLTLCAVSANCWALFFSSSVFSSARPSLSPRSFKAWLAFCTALVTLSAAEWSMLFPAISKEAIRYMISIQYNYFHLQCSRADVFPANLSSSCILENGVSYCFLIQSVLLANYK